MLSCKKTLTPTAYVQWFQTSKENVNTISTENFIYEIRYISPEAGALMEFGANRDSIKKYQSEYDQWSNFNMKIFSKDKSKDILRYKIQDESEYYQRLQYFISDFDKEISAINHNKTDTMHCAFHHYERTYNMTPFANISMSFEGKIEDIEKILIQLPFDNKQAVVHIKHINYPALSL